MAEPKLPSFDLAGARDAAKRVPGLAPSVRAARDLKRHFVRTSEEVRFLTDRLRRDRRIDEYLTNHVDRKLQLGSGSNVYDGWLNTDVVDYRRRNEVVYVDVRKPFPLPDASFDLVFSEHMIEHITYPEGQHCLRECHRVLRPSGRIRVATPSIGRLIKLYEPSQTELERAYLRWSVDTFQPDVGAYLPGFVVNQMLRGWSHQFVYDEQTLRHALESAGFVDVEEFVVGESNEPSLVGLERHMRSAADFNAFETLVLEARRPA